MLDTRSENLFQSAFSVIHLLCDGWKCLATSVVMTMEKWSLKFKSPRDVQVIQVASCGEHMLRSMAEHPAVRTSKCVREPVLNRTRLVVRPRMSLRNDPHKGECALKSPISMIGSCSDEIRL
nr:unnamed protein product [Callosobruchus analis]